MPDVPPLTLPDPPAPASPLRVGLSGGLDSSVLLHRLALDATLRTRGLRALHVHHGLHAQADAWAEACARQCAALGIVLDVVRVDVARDQGDGLEAAARQARHAAFEAALGDGEVLALAHHRDDQAETFLLRALRASGVDGLAAMRPSRRCGRGWLWRPLLDVPRTALLDYARAHGLAWIEDPSNADTAHDRNVLRHAVMPVVHARWPHAAAAFARAATLQAEAASLLAQEDAAALASARSVDASWLQVEPLRELDPARRARVLRLWLSSLGLPPLPGEGVARIGRDLVDDARGDAPAFAWRDAAVRRWRDLLWAGRPAPPLPSAYRHPWTGASPLRLPGDARLAFTGQAVACIDLPQDGFIVHARRGGERIRLPGRRHDHALKHVLQDLGVPPWQRAQAPLLSDAHGRLLAAGDLVSSAAFDAWQRARGCRLAWRPAG